MTYLFDLDGTLTDPTTGLYPAFRSALKALRIPELSEEELQKFVGSPLPEIFRDLKPGVTGGEIEFGIQCFRETYSESGVAGNSLYDGIPEVLDELRRFDEDMYVVTSKPEGFAKDVCEYLNITSYFRDIVGAGMDELDTKASLIERVLYGKTHSTTIVMVGDRHYDVIGAHSHKLPALGVLWGFGSESELTRAGADYIVEKPEDILGFHRCSGANSPKFLKVG